jgi:hypothetical protein
MSDIVEHARAMHALAADSCDPEYNRKMADELERLRDRTSRSSWMSM